MFTNNEFVSSRYKKSVENVQEIVWEGEKMFPMSLKKQNGGRQTTARGKPRPEGSFWRVNAFTLSLLPTRHQLQSRRVQVIQTSFKCCQCVFRHEPKRSVTASDSVELLRRGLRPRFCTKTQPMRCFSRRWVPHKNTIVNLHSGLTLICFTKWLHNNRKSKQLV